MLEELKKFSFAFWRTDDGQLLNSFNSGPEFGILGGIFRNGNDFESVDGDRVWDKADNVLVRFGDEGQTDIGLFGAELL